MLLPDEGFRTAEELGRWNRLQCEEAFSLVNIYFYNEKNPGRVIEPCDPSLLTNEQKERLLYWYICKGGASGFAHRMLGLTILHPKNSV